MSPSMSPNCMLSDKYHDLKERPVCWRHAIIIDKETRETNQADKQQESPRYWQASAVGCCWQTGENDHVTYQAAIKDDEALLAEYRHHQPGFAAKYWFYQQTAV